MSDDDLEDVDDGFVYASGVDGTTGKLLLSKLSLADVATVFQGASKAEIDEIRDRLSQRAEKTLGVAQGVDPDDLASSGWAVVFAASAPSTDARKRALAPLLTLRAQQAGTAYREHLYRGEDTASKFLNANHTGFDPPTPADGRMPYYVLLVGGLDEIPLSIQLGLGRNYAVGRLAFDHEDTPAGAAEEEAAFARYAAAAVRAESTPRTRTVGFFGTRNPSDEATSLSRRHFIKPLIDHVTAKHPTFAVTQHVAEAATKAALRGLFGKAPSLLVTASHGVGFSGHAEQSARQGALVCQEWAGPFAGAIEADAYFAASDLADDVAFDGSIALLFACYSLATPRKDTFSPIATAAEIAPRDLLSRLPQRLLSHPGGSMLAVIGHVDRAFPSSFRWPGTVAQIETMRSVVASLLEGKRVGAAMDYLGLRYMQLEGAIADQRDAVENGTDPDPTAEGRLFTARGDARGYAVLGDPAVRLNLEP